jgi:hypothetical protein
VSYADSDTRPGLGFGFGFGFGVVVAPALFLDNCYLNRATPDVGFLLCGSVWGAIHDIGGSAVFAASNLMVFGPGLTPPGLIPVVATFSTTRRAEPSRSSPSGSSRDRPRRVRHEHPALPLRTPC